MSVAIPASTAAVRLRRWLPFVAAAVFFALAVFALRRLAGEFSVGDVLATFRSIPANSVFAALACAAGSYFALTQYERMAVRHVAGHLSYSRVALTSFVAYALGHNLGFSALSGGAVRFRLYSAAGLDALKITQIIAFCALTFALGAASLTGLSLVSDSGRAAALLHVDALVATIVGWAILAAVVAWLVFSATRRAPLVLGRWNLALPPLPTALRQIGIACVDLLLGCATLYVLLPAGSDVSFRAFAGLYMIAIGAAVLSSVPAGLGVFESVFLLLLPGVPVVQLLGVLIAFRLIYYVLPFLLALVLLLLFELRQHRRRFVRIKRVAARALGLVAPQMLAVLTFLAGLVLLLSGYTPGIETRLAWLERWLPLSVVEVSHLASTVAGVALLILARGLWRRLDGAWLVSVWLLLFGAAASMLKGLDWEEATLLILVLGVLLLTRREFYRRASLLAEPLSRPWMVSVAVALGGAVAVGFVAYRDIPYRPELWGEFAFNADAPRMLRAMLGAVIAIGGFGLLRLLGPARPARFVPGEVDTDALLPVVRAANQAPANLALLGDKSILWSGSGRSFIMYGISGRTWVAMGDPVGDPAERAELIWKLRESADEFGASAAFYQVAPDFLPAYVDAGFALSKLGEEARVPLAEFALEGSARSPLRQTWRRAQRDGLSFRIAEPAEFATLAPALRAVSDDWLAVRSASEKGFSLGFFDERYLGYFPIALALFEGRTVGFANLWLGADREEFSVDLMRYSRAAPRNVMEYLFIELMLWGRAENYRWMNLGMAPLAGLEEHRLAPLWHKLGRLAHRFGEEFYNFEGLRAFKDKFSPQWRPRYLAAPGGFALARVMVDVTLLISGGMREALRRKPARRAPMK